MKKEDLKPDYKLPAQDGSDAGGKAKRVPLTPEQKEKRKKKLLKQREDNRKRMKDVPPEKRKKILEHLGYWITGWLDRHDLSLTEGPFSFDWLGSDAIRIITTYSLSALDEGTWKWPEDRDMYSQLKEIARSKMRHMIRDWLDDINNIKIDDMTASQEAKVEKAVGQSDLEEVEHQIDLDLHLRDLGYKKARIKLSKKPEFLKYVDVLEEYHTYDYMKKGLDMEDEKEVMKLEKKVLKYLATH